MKEQDQLWEVVGGVGKGGIVVRKGQSTTSVVYGTRLQHGAHVSQLELVGERLHYKKISGDGPDIGWVTIKLGGKDLVVKVVSDKTLPTGNPSRDEAQQQKPNVSEQKPILVTNVLEQLEREISSAGKQLMPVPPFSVPPLRMPPVVVAETAAPSTGSDASATTLTVNLAAGAQERNTDTPAIARDWLGDARQWLERLNSKAKVPASVRLPVTAVNWEPAAAVLSALTHGQFDPERDVAREGRKGASGEPGLVSVICSTSDRRRSFHPLLYENFRSQTHEARELVVIHTGEMPSEFFQERALQDCRVVYRFFPVTREAPGSPRLSDEKQNNPWQAVLNDDKVGELAMWEWGADPWAYEIVREGWTKGLKRNIGVCVARGAVIAHFDDGCLYAPEYLSRMVAELVKNAGGPETPEPAAVALSKWYTLSVKDQEFHLVDLKQKEPMWEQFGRIASAEQATDQLNHGFTHVYTRLAWHRQPFPDVETVGMGDSAFLLAQRSRGVQISLTTPPGVEGLAACGWHRDATCGSVEAAANVNYAQALNFFSFRGKPVDGMPKVFRELMPSVKEVATELGSRRDRYLRDLVEEHGTVHVCAYCNFAIALAGKEQSSREINAWMKVTDAVDMMQTYDKEKMKFECGYFSAAGGAVAEGEHTRVPPGHGWLTGLIQRMAICRNCGWQLGWRYEPEANSGPWDAYNKLFLSKGERSQADLDKLQGPVTWSLIWRHLRERKRPGEFVPEDGDREPPRHMETQHNRERGDVCPLGHKLRCFSTGQGNGGALPLFYTCDMCDRDARWNQHLYGCGTCDYDICDKCQANRARKRSLAH